MCGIFGYVGSGNASERIINGLKRLEYRGYDSWGVAVRNNGKIHVSKTVGAIGDVAKAIKLPKSMVGIGHTRWATHGGVTNTNAHPHYSTDESFVLAQNGIVQNYQELKNDLLKKGYSFNSDTDTEVIVRLVEDELLSVDNLRNAVKNAFKKLTGRNTIIVLSNKGKSHMIAVKYGSPLVVGKGNDKNEFFVASDTLSFSDYSNKVFVLGDFEMIELLDDDLALYNINNDMKGKIKFKKLDYKAEDITKDGHSHYMIKEIIEQKDTILEASSYTQKELGPLVKALKRAGSIYTIGAGGASFTAEQVAYFLRTYGKLKAINIRPYDLSSFQEMFQKDDVMIAVSQSGETADTIEALELAKAKGVKIASVVNMLGSTITRLSDYPYFSRSGPEICVISTKSGSAQTTFGYLLAGAVSGNFRKVKKDLLILSNDLEKYLSEDLFKNIRTIANYLAPLEHLFLLGRGQNFEPAIVGALNIKEASYLHAEGFSAGELKHGVIALISKGTPVIVFVSEDDEKGEMIAAAAEVKARGAKVIGIADKQNDIFDYYVPMPSIGNNASSIANIIPCQLFGYYIALEKGHDPDKPRNLAKSVTVK